MVMVNKIKAYRNTIIASSLIDSSSAKQVSKFNLPSSSKLLLQVSKLLSYSSPTKDLLLQVEPLVLAVMLPISM